MKDGAYSARERDCGRVRIGLIGCGKIGERHLAAYRKMPDCDVVLYDAVVSKAEVLAHRFGCKYVTDLRSLLEDPYVQAVDVCVPTLYHSGIVLDSLKHEKHVFCEKPLATTANDVGQIQHVAQDAGRLVMPGYLYRFFPAIQFVKEVLETGIIGQPYYAMLRLGGRGSHALWKHRRESGGGAVLEMLVHELDLAVWLFGPLQDVEVLWVDTLLRERRIQGEIVKTNAEDVAFAKLRSGDLHIVCEADLVTPAYMQYIDLQGDNGTILASILHYIPTVVYCQEPRGIFNQGNNIRNFPMVDAIEAELKHFIDAISGRVKPINSIQDSIVVMEIAEKILSLSNLPEAGELI